MLRATGFAGRGRAATVNEDCFAIDERLGLCVVADGMGGHRAGEIAARIAVDTIVDFLRDPRTILSPESIDAGGGHPFGVDRGLSSDANLLRTAILLANLRVLEAAATASHCGGMGTTVVAARVIGRHLIVGHVGDSRLYLQTPSGLRQVTSDDSWTATPSCHPMRGALTNVVGVSPCTDVHVMEEMASSAERLLLATDGVHGWLDDRTIADLLGGDEEPLVLAGRIVAAARARGSHDDCTAIVASVQPTNL
jgi:protein phosphatase